MSLEVIKLGSFDFLSQNSITRIKKMGNITELMQSKNKLNDKIYIKKMSENRYVDLRDGEIHQCENIDNRSENKNSVRQSLGRLRDYINTNVTDIEKCKWVTLTYKENMTDTKQLYKDFEKFHKRLKYKFGDYEYINTCEPQGRGAWHCHILLIFKDKAPYIKNDDMCQIWGQGYTKTKKLSGDINNLGAYLTAYLGDFALDDIDNLTDTEKFGLKGSCKDIEVEEDGVKVSKRIVKGGRLHLYPPKFNIYRCSRGIQKPIIENKKEKDIKKESLGQLTFEKTIFVQDTKINFNNQFNYRYYNSKIK